MPADSARWSGKAVRGIITTFLIRQHSMKEKHFTTTVLHADRRDNPEHGALHKPVHPSVAFGYSDARELAAIFQNKKSGYAYGRQSNPTVEALGRKITQMEDGLAS